MVRYLVIEVLPGPAGSTTTFGVGSGFKCAHSPGSGQPVEFHNATGTYSRGQPIAIACPTWMARKCSRRVTFMGRTFTANRGYPACTGDTTPLTGEYDGNTPQQQAADTPSTYTPGTPGTPGTYNAHPTPTPIAKTPSNGIFRVRIWGNFCFASGGICRSLKTIDTSILTDGLVNRYGYAATFRPGQNCGPERWPSPEMQRAGGPAYAEWCDVTVDVR